MVNLLDIPIFPAHEDSRLTVKVRLLKNCHLNARPLFHDVRPISDHAEFCNRCLADVHRRRFELDCLRPTPLDYFQPVAISGPLGRPHRTGPFCRFVNQRFRSGHLSEHAIVD